MLIDGNDEADAGKQDAVVIDLLILLVPCEAEKEDLRIDEDALEPAEFARLDAERILVVERHDHGKERDEKSKRVRKAGNVFHPVPVLTEKPKVVCDDLHKPQNSDDKSDNSKKCQILVQKCYKSRVGVHIP